ncbi:hypothetical protein [Sphingomonas yantingensis]|uniref:Uncharacterized protein n=1 Tax=Sphingomonas yantingensis TaxID=1241761 RepID=A0A7W9APJ9_9SPHN|nr:hypothetical protein [Sphingomonas yantingensis]MBB5698036.1 hypothetical protein [Sphingomonas yantingensis]
MRRSALFALTLTVALAAGARAQDTSTDAITARGRALFAHDRAAWVATDALTDDLPKAQAATVRGWIVEPAGEDRLRVSFLSSTGDDRRVIYTAEVAKGALGQHAPLAAPAALTAPQRAIATAIDAATAEAVRQGWRPCGKAPFNVAAIPTPTGTSVYLTTPQTRTDAWPMGGHFRVDVDTAGRVASSRRFANTCLEIGSPPKQAKAAMLVVTHVLDPTPTEIHVFASLSARMPVAVVTGKDRIWITNGAEIRSMR